MVFGDGMPAVKAVAPEVMLSLIHDWMERDVGLLGLGLVGLNKKECESGLLKRSRMAPEPASQ